MLGRHPDAIHILVGDGPMRGEVERAVADRAVPDVHLPGFLNRSEVARAYAAADVFVLPSALHETWGAVVNEAMNFSLPVVVTDKVGCAADLVRNGENGYVVPSDDVTDLARAIESLVQDPERRRAFGARSREVVDAWTYERAAEGVVEACAAAVGGRA